MQSLEFDILYCDTDSIISSKLLPAEFISGSKIGLMDIEHTLSEFQAKKPKMYYYKTIEGQTNYKVKGVSSDAIIVKQKNEITGIIEDVEMSMQQKYFETGSASKRKPIKPLQYLHNLKAVNSGNDVKREYNHMNEWLDCEKNERSKYNKRNINKNGTTTAIKINEKEKNYFKTID